MTCLSYVIWRSIPDFLWPSCVLYTISDNKPVITSEYARFAIVNGVGTEEAFGENPEFNEDIYSNFNAPDDMLINDVNPPIDSNINNQYIEDNPNYVDVSKQSVIDSVDEIIDRLKNVVNDIKSTSKFKIDTDEINYDDIYQITIKIDKRDF